MSAFQISGKKRYVVRNIISNLRKQSLNLRISQGIAGLWRGNSINVYRIAPQSHIRVRLASSARISTRSTAPVRLIHYAFLKKMLRLQVKFGDSPLGKNGKPTVLSLVLVDTLSSYEA
ncbi:hypothetical protein AAMO2058_000776700 [Amorphochlora amoebiformis]